MATDTAPLPVSTPPRRMWQLPTFVLGLAAVWAAATYVTPPPSAAIKQANKLEDLAAALERQPVDPGEVEPLVRHLADAASQTPRSHYLLGSGYLALASAKPTDSSDLWKLAAQHFDACDAATLKPEEATRLIFRNAKAKAAVGAGEPMALIAALMTVPAGEDQTECPLLIAQCALRLPEPDLKRARDELTKYLGSAHKSPPAVADRCKLKLADLNRSLGNPEHARRWLADISPNAPTDVQMTAKIALAQYALAEKNWAEAIGLFEGALALPGLPATDQGAIRYALGEALMKTSQVSKAMPLFEQASREPGLLGGQASLRIAEIRAADPTGRGKRGDAVDWLERAAAAIPAEAVSELERNSVLSIVKACIAEADYSNAMRAADVFGKLVGPEENMRLHAEVDSAWGAALQKAGDAAAATKKFLSAAKACEVAANPGRVTPAEVVAMRRQAVALYRKADARAEALRVLNLMLEGKSVDPVLVAALSLERAELLPGSDFEGVKKSLEAAMGQPGPQALAAKMKLAMLYVQKAAESTNKVEATQMGEFGRSLLRQVAESANVPAELRATHEQALFELGRLGLKDGKFSDAEARFKKQITLYPNGTCAGYGRLWLVCSLLQQARTSESKKLLEEALGYLQPLTLSSDPYLATYGEIWTANTHLELGNVTEALTRSKSLVDRYKGKPEELVAGKLLFYSYLKLATPEPAEASRALDRMEAAFAAMPKAAYPNDPEYSQERWKTQLPALREELRKFQQ